MLTKTNAYELQTKGSSEDGIVNPDSFAPAIGAPVTVRVCDLTAHNLSRIEGLPPLELYWPEKKRDKAVASIIAFLKQNGQHLKLKPPPWPEDEDD